MSNIETALQDFVEELKTSHDELGLRNAGNRFAVRLGYRVSAHALAELVDNAIQAGQELAKRNMRMKSGFERLCQAP